jgi:UDP-2-acetamido-3-amino-2,3-dideoxy-glucuronate N-acetyltransferase
MQGARIGRDCVLGQGCFVASSVVIGDRVRVQNNVSLFDGVVLEDEVFCGPSVVFTNVSRPRAAFSQKDAYVPTRVQRGATLGANVTVRCGVTIGEYAMVGAGSLVLEDVPAYGLAMGHPATQRGWVSRAGHDLEFDLANRARCPKNGEEYVIERGAQGPSVRPV